MSKIFIFDADVCKRGPEKVLQTSACRGQNQWPAPFCWTPFPPLNINFSSVKPNAADINSRNKTRETYSLAVKSAHRRVLFVNIESYRLTCFLGAHLSPMEAQQEPRRLIQGF
jgi:hypothetical protein